MTTTLSSAQLETIRAAYAPINKMPVTKLPQIHALFAGCSDAALAQLATAKIKFVSALAVNAQVRRKSAAVKLAEERGEAAFGKGIKAAPACDPGFTKIACNAASSTLEMLSAWSRGWHRANVASPV